ncbi:hypothetical protein CROQUDRAFT_664481 [Cronartium quercuum f. sp. fusiforme G11]|uniref:Uncharacterized protein n=1 Tax=Cronartium quercuum f. sp. fusiforme G11 TaxID=708437 RepID=A0A9P6N717_9BASI|nr:hypothetical protein CROQUDRAFT_664481 [Cronartium quercuum f. sp. fusiforme G11]
MSGLEKSLFQLKFTAKQLQKQSRKATRDEASEKTKLKKALQQGNIDGARIYASNAIRKHTEALNLLRLSSRIDAVSSRVETAVTMRSLTANMTGVVKGMDRAMSSMNLERITMVMDKFESQFDDLDLQTGYIESAIGHSTATTTPQDQVDLLIQTVADEAGLELQHGLGAVTAPTSTLSPATLAKDAPTAVTANEEQEDALAQRLRALRPAAS